MNKYRTTLTNDQFFTTSSIKPGEVIIDFTDSVTEDEGFILPKLSIDQAFSLAKALERAAIDAMQPCPNGACKVCVPLIPKKKVKQKIKRRLNKRGFRYKKK